MPAGSEVCGRVAAHLRTQIRRNRAYKVRPDGFSEMRARVLTWYREDIGFVHTLDCTDVEISMANHWGKYGC